MIRPSIPRELHGHRQWVRLVNGKPRDIGADRDARLDDRSTWSRLNSETDNIAFVLSPDDEFAVIDVVDCRDPKTGELLPEAKQLIGHCRSFTQVTPDGTGVRIWVSYGCAYDSAGAKLAVGEWVNRFGRNRFQVSDHGRILPMSVDTVGGYSEIRCVEVDLQESDFEDAPQDNDGAAIEATTRATLLRDEVSAYIRGLGSDSPLLTTGIKALDGALGGGIEQGELIVIGGRPGHGKSMLGMQLVTELARQGCPALVVSEEMPKASLAKRTIQYASGCSTDDWATNKVQLMADMEDHFSSLSDIFVDTNLREVAKVNETAERLVSEHGVKVLLIDYVQLLSGKGNGRYEQITNVSAELAQMTRALGLTTILVSQLNRQVEARKFAIPNSSDLRDSGQIEQDADIVIFGVPSRSIDSQAPQDSYMIYIAKNRNRPMVVSDIECSYHPDRMRVDGRDFVDCQYG